MSSGLVKNDAASRRPCFHWVGSGAQKAWIRGALSVFKSSEFTFLSVGTVWEIQIKLMLGKLSLRQPLDVIIADQMRENSLKVLPVTLSHALRLGSLPAHHKDPFDRTLLAQALVEDWEIVTHDAIISQHPVKVVW